MQNLGCDGVSVVPFFIDFVINNSFVLVFVLFQAVLADLSTLKVMPLLQIFLFATVT